jgi:hypothetical protein
LLYACTRERTAGIIYFINLLMAFQWGGVITYDDQDYSPHDGIVLAKTYMRCVRC